MDKWKDLPNHAICYKSRQLRLPAPSPAWIAESTLQQAKNVYTTLKMNNVPSELPSFLISQISEVVETQINYCRHSKDTSRTALKVILNYISIFATSVLHVESSLQGFLEAFCSEIVWTFAWSCPIGEVSSFSTLPIILCYVFTTYEQFWIEKIYGWRSNLNLSCDILFEPVTGFETLHYCCTWS